MVDYIIVGFGIAGANLAFRLEEMNRRFIVLDDGRQGASRVAGGLMNPVNLKRISMAWKADLQLEVAKKVYAALENQLGVRFLQPLEMYRKFSSIEEQNDWYMAMDKPRLSAFLDPELVREINPSVPSEHSFGRVLGTARIDTKVLLDTYKAYLFGRNIFRKDSFCFEDLEISEDGCSYKGLHGKRIIFCDGFGIRRNPFFNYLPIQGSKGEYLIIKAPDLRLDVVIKASLFLFPVEEDQYAVGATYSHGDSSPGPTTEARKAILNKLRRILTADFEVVDQIAGIRPVTPDRRPVVGRHPVHEHLYCCNGFGSRGILMAPWISGELIRHIETRAPLDPEIATDRFSEKYFRNAGEPFQDRSRKRN